MYTDKRVELLGESNEGSGKVPVSMVLKDSSSNIGIFDFGSKPWQQYLCDILRVNTAMLSFFFLSVFFQNLHSYERFTML